MAAVERAKRYIFDGDIMQVVLSQRMCLPLPRSPLALYRALRALNPSPYMFYFDFGGFHVVGASPEILVRLEGDTVTVRPIAGTRPRGKTREEDLALGAGAARRSEGARRAPHADGPRPQRRRPRGARSGSVQRDREHGDRALLARDAHRLQRRGQAASPGSMPIDVLRATFPAGTVSARRRCGRWRSSTSSSPSKRGIYAGAVGYLGFDGNMDVAIAIRTAVIKDGKLYVQAGAGIVADSVPAPSGRDAEQGARGAARRGNGAGRARQPARVSAAADRAPS